MTDAKKKHGLSVDRALLEFTWHGGDRILELVAEGKLSKDTVRRAAKQSDDLDLLYRSKILEGRGRSIKPGETRDYKVHAKTGTLRTYMPGGVTHVRITWGETGFVGEYMTQAAEPSAKQAEQPAEQPAF